MSIAEKPKKRLTDAERHKRVVEMSREVGASDDPKAFDKAFEKVISRPAGGKATAGKRPR
jgi:hypothetical protein